MKIMAIDYGDAHTGIAVSDALLTLAGFTTVITAYRPEAVAAEVQNLIAEHGVTELVLGHPLNMDGTRGPRAEKAEGFAALLRETTGLPVTLWDERRTTVDAHNILMAGGKNAKQRRSREPDARGLPHLQKAAEIAEKGSAGALPFFPSFFLLLFIGYSDHFLNLRIVSAMIV